VNPPNLPSSEAGNLTRKRSISSPNFSELDGWSSTNASGRVVSLSDTNFVQEKEDNISFSSVDMCETSSVITTETDAASCVLVNPRSPSGKIGMRKVPSFKDAILLNAEEKVREETNLAEREKEKVLKRQKDLAAFKSKSRPRLVVKPIQRCIRSTGDLRSLVVEEEKSYSGGGLAACHEVLGDMDAEEFYARKKHGAEQHTNGMKCRPDEAKRKQFIIHKKNAQRARQQAGE